MFSSTSLYRSLIKDYLILRKIFVFLQEDNLLSVASISFTEDFTSSLENCWIMAVSC